MTKKGAQGRYPMRRQDKVFQALVDGVPDLMEGFYEQQSDMRSLSFYAREQDVLGVARRDGADGHPEVLFASGLDWVDAMVQLSARWGSDRWKQDKRRD